MTDFRSCFSKHMTDMVAYRVSLGYSAATYEPRLKRFDSYVVEKHPEEKRLTYAIISDWLKPNGDGIVPDIQGRAGIVRIFAQYLVSVGVEAYVLPRGYVNDKTSFAPYVFSDKELTELFHAIDNIQNTEDDILKQATATTLFRLIYTCGLRPREGLRLKRKNVNLTTGEILVTETKMKKDRLVVMSSDMLYLMKTHSEKTTIAGRSQSEFFFSSPDGTAYKSTWSNRVFKDCFKKVNSNVAELPSVRVYDLRHRFASATLCRWLDEGKNLYSMLPYLRAYMGHSSLSQTAYYIHILPENLMKSRGVDWDKLDEVIPEAQAWEN